MQEVHREFKGKLQSGVCLTAKRDMFCGSFNTEFREGEVVRVQDINSSDEVSILYSNGIIAKGVYLLDEPVSCPRFRLSYKNEIKRLIK